MMRRSFLKHAGIGAMAGSAAVAAPVFAQSAPSVEWRLASSFPKTLDSLYGAGVAFCKAVAQASGGKFQIHPYPAGDVAPGLQVLEAVTNNQAACGHTASHYYYSQEPALCFDGAVPFGLNARQMNAWMLEGDGLKLTRDLFKPHHIINFPMGNTGAQMGGWFRKEIRDQADLKDLRIRTAGLAGAVLERLGAAPVQLEAGQIQASFEKNELDAAEFIGPYDDEKLSLNKLAKYYYAPGWWEGGAQLSLYINENAWEQLPQNYQAIVEAASWQAHVGLTARYDAQNPPALRRLRAAGTELRVFPRSLMDAAFDASQAVCQELAAKDLKFKLLYDNYMGFRDSVVPWFRVADNPFDQYMGVALGVRR